MFKKLKIIICILFISMFCVAPVEAKKTYRHSWGLTYVSGLNDIADFLEDIGYDTATLPVGVSYKFIANYNSDFRLYFGVGPIALVFGDTSYYDIPLRATLGYALQLGDFRPYIRGGISYHFNNGDYLEEKGVFGLVGAVGIELGKKDKTNYFIEASYDTAEATFEGFSYYSDDVIRRDIKISGFMLTIGVIFE